MTPDKTYDAIIVGSGAGGGRGSWEAFRLLRIEERKNRA